MTASLFIISSLALVILPRVGGAEPLSSEALSSSFTDTPRITGLHYETAIGTTLRVDGAPGEYRIEVSEDLHTWTTLHAFGLTDGSKNIGDEGSADTPMRFYRLISWLASDGFHLQGDFAQAFTVTISQLDSDGVIALGLDFDPSEVPLPTVDELAAFNRNGRVLAAIIGSLSHLAQSLRDTLFPDAKATDLIAALTTDLSSGRLDGTGPDGEPVMVGESSISPFKETAPFILQSATATTTLPPLSVEDLLKSFANLKDEFAGMENIVFSGSTEDTLLISVPAQWNSFYWNSADWQ